MSFAAFNVGDEVFGSLAPVFDSLAEKTFPILENLIKIVLVNLLFDGRIVIFLARALNQIDEQQTIAFAVGQVVNVLPRDNFGRFKVGNKLFARRTWSQVPIVRIFVVKRGESFSREQCGKFFRDNADILAQRAVIGAEFQFSDVIESLSDTFGKFVMIFEVCIEFELEKNSFGVQVDKIFARRLEIKFLHERELQILFGFGFGDKIVKIFGFAHENTSANDYNTKKISPDVLSRDFYC